MSAAPRILFAHEREAIRRALDAAGGRKDRAAQLLGISRTGLYANGQKMREVLPDAELLPKYFSRHGYWAGGSGKMSR